MHCLQWEVLWSACFPLAPFIDFFQLNAFYGSALDHHRRTIFLHDRISHATLQLGPTVVEPALFSLYYQVTALDHSGPTPPSAAGALVTCVIELRRPRAPRYRCGVIDLNLQNNRASYSRIDWCGPLLALRMRQDQELTWSAYFPLKQLTRNSPHLEHVDTGHRGPDDSILDLSSTPSSTSVSTSQKVTEHSRHNKPLTR